MTPDDDKLPQPSDATPTEEAPAETTPAKPEIEPQPAPSACGVCASSQWELHAHLPIETEAYLEAVATLNRRLRSSKKRKTEAAVTPVETAQTGIPADDLNDAPNREAPDSEAETTEPDRDTTASENGNETADRQATAPPDEPATAAPEVEPEPSPLGYFPHGTAWRCAHCGALTLVWPTSGEPVARPSRRRSSAEFRTAVTRQVERVRNPKLARESGVNLKTLRVLDLNLGRGTTAERNLVLLHELGLAKHQIFGLGGDTTTIERLNFAGYQVYGGGVDRALAELPDDYFDLVLGFNAIEYWHDTTATLKALTRKRRVGARLVLELANPESWQAQLFRNGYWASYRRDCHLLVGGTALRHLAARVGLQVETLRAHPEPQAWKTSSATWKRRKRHPLKFALGSGLAQETLIGLDRLRAACGMNTSRYGAVLVVPPVPPPEEAPVETPEGAPEDSATP